MIPTEIVRNERGADVCHRIVEVAVENVTGDASKGFHYVKAYCNQPVILNISENQKMCPKCDKIPPVGNVHPRVTNAAGVKLTPKELAECGVTEDTSLIKVESIKVTKKSKEKKPVEGKVKKVNKDEINLSFTLDSLEGDTDVASYLIKATINAMDNLPTPTLAESKRLIKLQERLQKLLEV